MPNATLRLLADLALASIAGWLAFALASDDRTEEPRRASSVRLPDQQPLARPILEDNELQPQRSEHSAFHRDEVDLEVIRSAVLNAIGEDMAARGVAISDCLVGLEVVGPQKIRFEVDVDATPSEVRTGAWRFSEIVDGHLLPDSFATCAERALGGHHVIAPRHDESFPTYRGPISMLYRIP